jgi:hypothetical protein
VACAFQNIALGGGEAGLTQLVTPWLWAVFTVIAAFMQTLRNAMQRAAGPCDGAHHRTT